jgi:Nif-specific regulatory protein
VPKSVINRLLLHDWPGNVRELENLIQRAVLMSKGKMITEGDLLFDQDPRMEQPVRNGFDLNGRLGSLPLKEILAEVETAVITETLRRCEGNVGLAATQLHIGKTALYDKMKQRGILPKVLRKPD